MIHITVGGPYIFYFYELLFSPTMHTYPFHINFSDFNAVATWDPLLSLKLPILQLAQAIIALTNPDECNLYIHNAIQWIRMINDITTHMRMSFSFSSNITGCVLICDHNVRGDMVHHNTCNLYVTVCSTSPLRTFPTHSTQSHHRFCRICWCRIFPEASAVQSRKSECQSFQNQVQSSFNAVKKIQPKSLPHPHFFFSLPPVELSTIWSILFLVLYWTHMHPRHSSTLLKGAVHSMQWKNANCLAAPSIVYSLPKSMEPLQPIGFFPSLLPAMRTKTFFITPKLQVPQFRKSSAPVSEASLLPDIISIHVVVPQYRIKASQYRHQLEKTSWISPCMLALHRLSTISCYKAINLFIFSLLKIPSSGVAFSPWLPA